jgi:hypothetical protein
VAGVVVNFVSGYPQFGAELLTSGLWAEQNRRGDADTAQRGGDQHRDRKSQLPVDSKIGDDRCNQAAEDRTLVIDEAGRRRAYLGRESRSPASDGHTGFHFLGATPLMREEGGPGAESVPTAPASQSGEFAPADATTRTANEAVQIGRPGSALSRSPRSDQQPVSFPPRPTHFAEHRAARMQRFRVWAEISSVAITT